MKKIFTLAAIAVATLSLTGCGMATAGADKTLTGAGNGSVLGSVASSVIGNNTSNGSTASSLAATGLNILTNLLGGGSMNKNSIVGTWTYDEPAVTFESSNMLAQLGGQVASNKIQNTLGSQLGKVGLTKGVSKFTFDDNGNVTMTVGGKTTKGTYTLNGNTLTMKGALGIASLTCTTTINANQLYMLFDTSTLLSMATKLGAGNSTLSSLLGNYSGMKMGWKMSR